MSSILIVTVGTGSLASNEAATLLHPTWPGDREAVRFGHQDEMPCFRAPVAGRPLIQVRTGTVLTFRRFVLPHEHRGMRAFSGVGALTPYKMGIS